MLKSAQKLPPKTGFKAHKWIFDKKTKMDICLKCALLRRLHEKHGNVPIYKYYHNQVWTLKRPNCTH